MDSSGLEKILQEGKLHRQLNALVVAYLRDNNFTQAASAVAAATMIPLDVDVPRNKLLDVFAKGVAADKDESIRGVASISSYDKGAFKSTGYGSTPLPRAISLDFSATHVKLGSSKGFPKHESRHISEHKNDARCARISSDGKYLATGSADTSIKLFEISKIKQMMQPDSRDGPIRPVIRTFYDHNQAINDIDFHPHSSIIISGSKDRTIKIFDFSKASAKRATRVIQDTHNVRSVAFHPSGDFLLAGTDHPIPHLYDVNTLQCYVSATSEFGVAGGVNQVKYSVTGGIYATASKDGTVRLWDGVTSECVRSLNGAHGTSEATSVVFTKDQRFILSSGKDSTIKLWDVGSGRIVKQYTGATHMQLRYPAIFNQTEEFVISIDELNNEIVVWDALTTEKVARWPTNHVGAPRWIEHSPTERSFLTCGADRAIRFWKEI